MQRLAIAVVALMLAAGAATAQSMNVQIRPDAKNPGSPQMGDHLSFHTTIRNTGNSAADGVIAWISLVQTDPGKEQPVDLEDWSAHKALVIPSLKPDDSIETDWPMRLIQSGTYRVVVSATSRAGTTLAVSPFADFTVREKPVVESRRVLPVALGLPVLIVGAMFWRRGKARK